ncbi:hypothetical protein CPB83DRAFT_857440 [Crepidotus variabilis]|uniref:Uncharacterized protein n=1 Tax=Crepidotus variabilis TaxID=179855 RepID=A0A9P6JN93_9AGAR|nr:hypothetical protein CPB83DRAFT_857440 [Crepidotus variabilis]
MELAWGPHHRQTSGPDNPLADELVTPAPNIGDRVSFTAGQFAGRTLRFQLEELQKADSGRKKVFNNAL